MAGKRKQRTVLVMGFLALGLSACVERNLTVVTEPPGAMVYLNDEEAGHSPVTVSFQWYGDYQVLCRKDGYAPLRTHRQLKAPWYDYFPFDFFAQVLYPGRIEDNTTWNFVLTPQQPMDQAQLMQQAESLRSQLTDPNTLGED